MGAIFTEMARITRLITGSPASNLEMVAIILLGAVGFISVLSKVGKSLNFPMCDSNRSIGVLFIGVALLAIGPAAVYVYVPETLPQTIIAIAAAVIIILAIVAPLSCAITKSRYFGSLFAILLGIAASIAVGLMVHAGFRAVRNSGGTFNRTKKHNEEIEELL